MNRIRQFFRDLCYMPRYLFFRIYFGKVFAAIALYISLIMFTSAYTYMYNDFKIYKGNFEAISFNQIRNSHNENCMVEIKLVDEAGKFESYVIDKKQKSYLDYKLQYNSTYEIYTPRIAPSIIFSNRKINLIKSENGIIIYKHSIDYQNNLILGLFSLLFTIWLLWISSKR